MVDNFELLKSFYEKNKHSQNDDYFLFGQIMARKKDNARYVKSNNKVIKDLVFRTVSDFDDKKEEIIELCDLYGARAYLNVNPRSYKEVAIEMAGLCLDYIRKGSEVASRTAFSTVCGRIKPKDSYWVVDVDDIKTLPEVIDLVPEPAICVPTVNGVHLLTRGFDSRKLKEKLPDIDIHKNNPTVLYYGGKNSVFVNQ